MEETDMTQISALPVHRDLSNEAEEPPSASRSPGLDTTVSSTYSPPSPTAPPRILTPLFTPPVPRPHTRWHPAKIPRQPKPTISELAYAYGGLPPWPAPMPMLGPSLSDLCSAPLSPAQKSEDVNEDILNQPEIRSKIDEERDRGFIENGGPGINWFFWKRSPEWWIEYRKSMWRAQNMPLPGDEGADLR